MSVAVHKKKVRRLQSFDYCILHSFTLHKCVQICAKSDLRIYLLYDMTIIKRATMKFPFGMKQQSQSLFGILMIIYIRLLLFFFFFISLENLCCKLFFFKFVCECVDSSKYLDWKKYSI